MSKFENAKTTASGCLCGCGEATSSSRTNYRPGHDARHAGIIARLLVEDTNGLDRDFLLAKLPSQVLQAKAMGMERRLREKAQGRKQPADRKPKATTQEGQVPEVVPAVEEGPAPIATIKGEPVAPMWEETTQDETPWTVKVGRWTYPAKRVEGVTYRNTKRDGSGEWVHYQK